MSSAPLPARPLDGDDKADARARRIAAAVERSKTEYQAEHAYTERGWFLNSNQAGPSKADRQHVEYASTRRLLAPELNSEDVAAKRALADILSLPKPASLPRELVATGIRAAMRAGDRERAAEMAHSARAHWRANVGLAVVASEALAAAGNVAESTHPLLHAMAYALHYPVLCALSDRLGVLLSSSASSNPSNSSPTTHTEPHPTSQPQPPASTHQLSTDAHALATLAAATRALAASRAWAFPPLFGATERALPRPVEGGAELRAALGAVDVRDLAGALGLVPTHGEGKNGEAAADEDTKEEKDVLKILEGALRRMGGALSRQHEEDGEAAPGERVERGVREL